MQMQRLTPSTGRELHPALWLALMLLLLAVALGPVWAEAPKPERGSPPIPGTQSGEALQQYPPPATETPTPAITPTDTPVPPTATPTQGGYPPPATDTPTPIPPTNTPTPTDTPVPTVLPPTSTPTTSPYPWPSLTPRAYLPLILKAAGAVSPTATPTVTCSDVVRNGGFEQISDWYLPKTNYPADYSTAQAHGGNRSMRLGIVNSYHNTYSYSDAQQTVTLPAGLASAKLRFWAYPMSKDAGTVPTPYPRAAASLEALGYDVQYLLILDQWDNWIDTLLWQARDDQKWLYYEFDIIRYAGRTIKLQFGVYNTGYGGVTAMYVDDVSLEVCYGAAPTATATPTGLATATPTSTPTPTATPWGCYEGLVNGGFESYGGWWIPTTRYSAGYSTAMPHSGAWSMRLGIVNAGDNTYSYSDAQQTVYIPTGISRVTLRFWAYPQSGDARTVPWPTISMLGDIRLLNLSYDVQYLLILDKYSTWIDTLLWQARDDRQWLFYEFDLTRYAGQTIKLQFGAYNTGYGGVTSMYLDDASLEICYW